MTGTGYLPHDITREDRPDGTVILRSAYPLGPVVRTSADWLDRWAAQTPSATFLAERSGAGWREVSYGETREQVHALGELVGDDRAIDPMRLLALDLGEEARANELEAAADFSLLFPFHVEPLAFVAQVGLGLHAQGILPFRFGG